MNFILANDLALNVLVQGNPGGTPLVFINSLGTDLRIWDQVMPGFIERFSVIRYDKRGHGLSDATPAPYSIRDHATDLAGVLEQLNVTQAILVGISVGGMIAIDFAAAWPEKVRSLVLCDTAPVIGTAEMWNERINTLRQKGMDSLREVILSRWFSPSFVVERPSEYRGYANMLTRTPVEGYTGTCEAIRDADLTEAARNITVPTLVLCGEDDLATPPQLTKTICELIPQAEYQEIPGAAHLPCIERPEVMAEKIRIFL